MLRQDAGAAEIITTDPFLSLAEAAPKRAPLLRLADPPGEGGTAPAGGCWGASHWTGNVSHGDGWADAPPIVVVAKSAKLRFRLRRKLRPLPCSSSPHRAGRGGGPFWSCPKRECAAPGGKEKMFGGSVCASADLLPPAGEGWLSLAAVRDGNALPLGKPLARGSLGYIPRRFSLPLTGG